MYLTSYIGIGLAIIVIIMVLLIYKRDKIKGNNKPYLLSILALSLIVFNLVLYLFDFYAIIPERIGDLIFSPIWIIVSIIGFIAAYKEFSNNRTFAVVNGGLSVISSIVGILAWGIGNM